jgi:hypothetical protein
MKKRPGFKSIPSFVNELSDTDMQQRYEACEHFLHIFQTIPAHEKVVFSDECAIHHSEKLLNVYFW